ncbi:MAG: CDGSH iron-sulfur domain-containing protein [Solirubrobacteraceae bacterium]
MPENEVTVLIIDNGPLKVSGGVTLVDDATGQTVPGSERDPMMLCRCGGSKNKPFCDGTHSKIGFQGAMAAVEAADAAKD